MNYVHFQVHLLAINGVLSWVVEVELHAPRGKHFQLRVLALVRFK
jgi:hypothetical protein